MTSNPCEWCRHTSEIIDSLEYKIELLTKENERLTEMIDNIMSPELFDEEAAH